MRPHRTHTSSQPRRLRLGAAATGVAALILVTGCGPSGEAPEAAPAATGAADATAETPAADASAGGSAGGDTQGEAMTIDQPAGGQTQLTLDQGFLDTLQTLQVDVQPVAPATMEGSTFSFPVTGGNVTVDPQSADPLMGMLQHEGGLQLSALGRSVEFTELMLDAEAGQVTAEVNGRRIPLIDVGKRAADVARQADEVMVSQEAAAFSPEALQALTEQLGLPNVQLPEVTMGQLETMIPSGG